MSSWNDTDRWSALCSGVACPICQGWKPLDIVAELVGSWVTMAETAPVRGYVCLVSKIHAVEFHDLTEAAGAAFCEMQSAYLQLLPPARAH